MKIVLIFFLFISNVWAASVDLGPLFPSLIDSSGNSAALTKSVSGDAASGKTGSTAFVFKDSSGNIVLPQLHIDGSIKVYSPGFATASNTRPSVSNTDSTIVSANSVRKYLIISNNAGSPIWIKLGGTAVVNQGIEISPGGVFEINQNNLWLGSINAIKSGASINIDVFEGTQ